MKVLIMRASNTKNYGSLMMVANYIRLYKDKYPESSFIVDNVEVDGLDRIIQSSGVEEIESFKTLEIPLRPECKGNGNITKLFKYASYSLGFGKLISNVGVDKVVQLGGDDFSEYYSIKALTIEFLKLQSMISKGISISLVGQTMGPFSSWRKVWAKNLLSKVSIYSRDYNSAKYLVDELNLDNVNIAADLAYLPLYKQDSKEVSDIVNSMLDGFNTYNVIVPSGLWKAYTSNFTDYITSYKNLIDSLILKGERVLILSHVLSDTSSDNKIIDELRKVLKPSNDVKFISDTILPVEAREIISRAQVVISGRMHACVSAYQVGVPAIPLSYSVKFKGVIGELDIEHHMIDSVGDTKWKPKNGSSEMVERIITELDSINHLGISSEKIKKEVIKLEERIMTQFES
ncbi:polysaccharide pyruvyl transferase family protein [Pseudoalteromonas sp. SCSIO 43088]|uniref:polysaccharide pyruvyl transferase family protein n=1 Tax=Pseudoalteromonas sp. SCSIO 43088 TaxID=2822846 RepID=UPI00202ACFF9|nr:polysaccharide pyruvyl transferase family protein [Pseudoalteromonas sp. SCSIO 43088]URQ86600.1 polysaccharide pyruvyl transferase family protein [Pseudoalteromonas sp. SCSIO 43088]